MNMDTNKFEWQAQSMRAWLDGFDPSAGRHHLPYRGSS